MRQVAHIVVALLLSFQALSPQMIVVIKRAPAAGGSVTFDATAATGSGLGTVTSASFSLVISGSTNIGVVVGVMENVKTSGALTVTVGGSSATLVSGSDSDQSSATTIRSRFYCVAVGSMTGSQTVSVSGMNSNVPVIGAVSFTGVNQTTPCVNGTFSFGDFDGAGDKLLSVTSTTSSQVVWQLANDTGAAISGANKTERWNVRNNFTLGASGQTSVGSAGATSGGYLSQVNSGWVMSGVSVQP